MKFSFFVKDVKVDVNKLFFKIFDNFYQDFKLNYRDELKVPTNFKIEIDKLTKIANEKHLQRFITAMEQNHKKMSIKKNVEGRPFLAEGILVFAKNYYDFYKTTIINLESKNMNMILTSKEELEVFCNLLVDQLKEKINKTLDDEENKRLLEDQWTIIFTLENIFYNMKNVDNEFLLEESRCTFMHVISKFYKETGILDDTLEFMGGYENPYFDQLIKIYWRYIELIYCLNIVGIFTTVCWRTGKSAFRTYELNWVLQWIWFFSEMDDNKFDFDSTPEKVFEGFFINTFLKRMRRDKLTPNELTTQTFFLKDFYSFEYEVTSKRTEIFDIKYYMYEMMFQNVSKFKKSREKDTDSIKSESNPRLQLRSEYYNKISWSEKEITNASLESLKDLRHEFMYKMFNENWQIYFKEIIMLIQERCMELTGIGEKRVYNRLTSVFKDFLSENIYMLNSINEKYFTELEESNDLLEGLYKMMEEGDLLSKVSCAKLNKLFDEWDFKEALLKFNLSAYNNRHYINYSNSEVRGFYNTKDFSAEDSEKYNIFFLSLLKLQLQQKIFYNLLEIYMNDGNETPELLKLNF